MVETYIQMLKSFAQRYHLSLQRGQNAKILFTLMINHFLWLSLQLRKKIKGIHRPIIHYYAVCWNEEKILPWMFNHYEDFVDYFFIYDNYSSDNTEQIVRNSSKTTLIKFGHEGRFNDADNQAVKNQCWKRSRGKADLVVVCDMDEFLYHQDLTAVLQRICERRVSFPSTVGYEMYSDRMPEYDGVNHLPDLVKEGKRSDWLDKHIIFDPHRIVDINFDPGAHHANPTGIVNRGNIDTELKVLHYKYLGLDYLLDRYQQLGERLSSYNIQNDLGTHYLAKRQELMEHFNSGLNTAKNVVD